jgi:uncharacterized protein YukE
MREGQEELDPEELKKDLEELSDKYQQLADDLKEKAEEIAKADMTEKVGPHSWAIKK